MKRIISICAALVLAACASPPTSFVTKYKTINTESKAITDKFIEVMDSTNELTLILGCPNNTDCNNATSTAPGVPPRVQLENKNYTNANAILTQTKQLFPEHNLEYLRLPQPKNDSSVLVGKSYQLQSATVAMANYYSSLEAIATADGKKEVEESFKSAIEHAGKIDTVAGLFGVPSIFETSTKTLGNLMGTLNEAQVNAKKRPQMIALMEQQRWLPRLMAGEAACEERNKMREKPNHGLGEPEVCTLASLTEQCVASTVYSLTEKQQQVKALKSAEDINKQARKECAGIKYYTVYTSNALITSVTLADGATSTIDRILDTNKNLSLVEKELLIKRHDDIAEATLDLVIMLNALQTTLSKAAIEQEKAFVTINQEDTDYALAFTTLAKIYTDLDTNIEALKNTLETMKQTEQN